MPPAEEELTGALVRRLVARTGRAEGLVTGGSLRPKGQPLRPPRSRWGGLLHGGVALLLILTVLAVGIRSWAASADPAPQDRVPMSGAATTAPCWDLAHLLGRSEAGTCSPAAGSR
jgi:ABC-type Fe3+ transport system permease subunit